MFDQVIRLFSFIGALVAFLLGIMKIIDMRRNKPILKGQGLGWVEQHNDKILIGAWFEITNVGRQTTIIKKVLLDILGERKQQINVHSRLVDLKKMKKQLIPNDYTSNIYKEEIDKKLYSGKLYYRVKVHASHSSKTKCICIIPLIFRTEDAAEKAYDEAVEEGRKKGRIILP